MFALRTLAFLLITAAVSAFFVGPLPQEAGPKPAQKLACGCGDNCQCGQCDCGLDNGIAHALSCSLMVETDGEYGSAVVHKNRAGAYAWTDAHVVEGARKGKNVFSDVMLVRHDFAGGRKVGERKWHARVVRYSRLHDIALLKFRDAASWDGGSGRLAGDECPAQGSPIFHVGSMHGPRGFNSVSTGVVAATGRLRRFCLPDEADGLVYDQVSLIALPGSSGGGVFRKDGACLGLITEFMGPGYTPGVLCYTPARRLREWARKHKCLHGIGEGEGKDDVGPVVDE